MTLSRKVPMNDGDRLQKAIELAKKLADEQAAREAEDRRLAEEAAKLANPDE